MADRVAPFFDFDAVEFKGKYVFVAASLRWDEGESELGAGRITFHLPVPPRMADRLPELREATFALLQKTVDSQALRSWRGDPPQSQ